MMQLPKAYSYVRWSSPDQSGGDSARRQDKAAEDYATEHNLQLDNHTYRDIGISALHGKNASRGALHLFRTAVDEDLIEGGSYLLIESFDRLSRQAPWDALPIFQEIANAGITIVTLSDRQLWSKEELQQNPLKLISWLIVASRAHEESKIKSFRSAANQAKKRLEASTKKMSSRCPAWLKDVKGHQTAFNLIPDRAAIVKRIFDDAALGRGDQSIVISLNADHIATWGDNGRAPASMWHKSYVQKILGNHAVIGTLMQYTSQYDAGVKRRILVGQVPGYYPPVISVDLWNQVKAIKESRSPARGRNAQAAVKNILGGLAKCASCGNSMTRICKGQRDPINRLVCTSVKNGTGCKTKSLVLDLIEEALPSQFEKEAQSWLGNVASQFVRSNVVSSQTEIDILTRHIDNYSSNEQLMLDDQIRLRVSEFISERLNLIKKQSEYRPEYTRMNSFVNRLRTVSRLLAVPEIDRSKINALLRAMFYAVVVDSENGTLCFEYLYGGQFFINVGTVSSVDRHNSNASKQLRAKNGRFIRAN